MDKERFEEERLQDFAVIYIAEAERLADGRPRQDFYDELFRVVAKEMCIDQGLVKHLHHCFHWSMFNRESPFKHKNATGRDGKDSVYVEGDLDVDSFASEILGEWSSYLIKRINSFYQEAERSQPFSQ